jgi:hypothetical protein
MLFAKAPLAVAAAYNMRRTSNTFFLPEISDILPAIGVITAATIRYALNNQAAEP